MIDGHGTAVASAAAGNRVGAAPGAALVSICAFGFVALTPARLAEALDVIRHAWDPAAPPFEKGHRDHEHRPACASITGRDHYRPAYLSSGTSYAAPYVAGIAARLLSRIQR